MVLSYDNYPIFATGDSNGRQAIHVPATGQTTAAFVPARLLETGGTGSGLSRTVGGRIISHSRKYDSKLSLLIEKCLGI